MSCKNLSVTLLSIVRNIKVHVNLDLSTSMWESKEVGEREGVEGGEKPLRPNGSSEASAEGRACIPSPLTLGCAPLAVHLKPLNLTLR
ncbi:hypothetical protein HOLleu_12720 [Holothuria leucospilota]|uniref:Uncharacterized protein n=1 Tax=Holothuria leucospilota TaxID=206669 RepID=A0A9Q1CBD8_HOLLE|nr:hypothetical protein HOLleu_12720 [Holothuria leucospilota]